ncbi:hypothetical protein [Neomegalonema sp.]|uniref:hypothetical protein n=1 Tax=Neomegalonema sp. TaxID=2039713 RepID=UPI00261AC50D|nr:hypothetical protein [Neomegalonema sp.]MDD2870106.1 hypothetical protein [Neomegalonema sp.]
MTHLPYFGAGSRLKSFSGATKGAEGVIKIEISTSDLGEFGYSLRRLAELEQEQKQEEARRRADARRQKLKLERIASAPPLLGLPAPDREDF